MDIDFDEFMLLTPEQKCSFIWKEGIYLGGRIKGELTFNLYSVFCLYMEIGFNLANNCIEEIKIIRNTDLLEPYLEEIDLPCFLRT